MRFPNSCSVLTTSANTIGENLFLFILHVQIPKVAYSMLTNRECTTPGVSLVHSEKHWVETQCVAIVCD